MSDVRPLAAAVREIEGHVAEGGWDQSPKLFALVETAVLAGREPELAETLGLSADEGSLTPVAQELDVSEQPFEDLLAGISWPGDVSGCAVVVERLVLPPGADEALPDHPRAAVAAAVEHPERQEVRIVAAATRTGATYCALRLRAHDEAASVVTGPDIVPGLLELVRATLEEDPQA